MRSSRSNPALRHDHYRELTDPIIAALEAGTAPWRRPWNPDACDGSQIPVNAATGHRYRGVNRFALGIAPLALSSGDPRWCSYRQALARGWQVRKGEKATPVYFYKPIEIADKDSDVEAESPAASRFCASPRSSTLHRSRESPLLLRKPRPRP